MSCGVCQGLVSVAVSSKGHNMSVSIVVADDQHHGSHQFKKTPDRNILLTPFDRKPKSFFWSVRSSGPQSGAPGKPKPWAKGRLWGL